MDIKKVFSRFFSIMFLLINCSVHADEPKRPFVWIDDEDYKPLIYRESDGKSAGLFYDVLTEAFKRMKVPLQNRLYPWSRAQNMVLKGEGDGMVTVYTPIRQKFFFASEPILEVHEHVFTSKKNPKLEKIINIRSVEDLKYFTIVDTSGSGWSKENLKGMRIIWVPTAQSAINMIATNRADIYLMNDYTGPYFIKDLIAKGGPLKDEIKEIVMGNYPVAIMEYRLLVRKDSPYTTLIERFNETLEQMKKDGSYEKIVKQYRIDMKYHPNKTQTRMDQ